MKSAERTPPLESSIRRPFPASLGPRLLLILLSVLLVLLWAAPAASAYSSQELEFLRLINDYRTQNGLNTLLISDLASDASEKHSQDMATYGFFDHDTQASDYFPVGSTLVQRLAASGYSFSTYKGENIAAGQSTAAQVFSGWKNSSGHNANMLNPNYRVIGIGLVTGGPYGYYWTTDFGGFVDSTAHDPTGSTAPTTTSSTTSPTTTTAAAKDTTPPVVTFTSPRAGSVLEGTVSIQASASDAGGVARVEFLISGRVAATDYTAPYAGSWDTRGVADGSYTLAARAYDKAGNSALTSISVTVRSTALTTTTAAPTTTTTKAPTTTTAKVTTTTVPRTTTTVRATTTTTAVAPTTTATTTTTSTTVVSSPSPSPQSATTVTVRTTSTTLPAPVLEDPAPIVSSFSDVPEDHRFYVYIGALADRGVIQGFGDGSFGPDRPVLRAQFAKVLVGAMGRHDEALGDTNHACFPDVTFDGSSYPYDYVEEASHGNLVRGFADGSFGPYRQITRAQLAVMIYRAAGSELQRPPADYEDGFVDVAGLAAEAREAIRMAKYNGILDGKSDGIFDPSSSATRGHVAKMTYGLLKLVH